MDDVKKIYREGEQKAKEAWRQVDGNDVKDKVGNAGDEVRKDLGNAGDDIKRAGKDAQADADREQHGSDSTGEKATSGRPA